MWRAARAHMWVKDGLTTAKRLRPLIQPADRLSTFRSLKKQKQKFVGLFKSNFLFKKKKKSCQVALTLLLVLARHLQVHSGQAELVGLLRGQVLGRLVLVLLLHGVANAEAAPHGGHLPVELLPCDLVVKAQPAELDLHPGRRRRTSGLALTPNAQGGGTKVKSRITIQEKKKTRDKEGATRKRFLVIENKVA